MTFCHHFIIKVMVVTGFLYNKNSPVRHLSILNWGFLPTYLSGASCMPSVNIQNRKSG